MQYVGSKLQERMDLLDFTSSSPHHSVRFFFFSFPALFPHLVHYNNVQDSECMILKYRKQMNSNYISPSGSVNRRFFFKNLPFYPLLYEKAGK